MGVFPIGDQRVGVELSVPVLDGDGNPTFSDYGQPHVTAVVFWVDNALFEVPPPGRGVGDAERQDITVTTSEVGQAFLPVADSAVPAVDGDGNDAPIAFLNEAGKPTISANVWLWHNGLRYAMRGDSVLERDIRGREDHVFCLCEREQG